MSRTINEIFVHCSATRRDWMSDQSAEAKRDEIDRWHRQRGWKGFGYHYLIDRDGTVVAYEWDLDDDGVFDDFSRLA